MARTLSQIATDVLRNCEIPEDSSTTQALVDAKSYINERARTIWRAPLLFPEYLILGTYTIPAGQTSIALSAITAHADYATSARGYNATFDKVIAIREGVNPLMPEDAGAIQKLQADLWASTTTPTLYVPRGNQGIALLGAYSTDTVLSFFGKAKFQALTDAESWIVDEWGDALVAGGSAEFLRKHERDENRAAAQDSLFAEEFKKLVHERKVQGADVTRVVPLNPWTNEFSGNHDTSKIGIDNNFW